MTDKLAEIKQRLSKARDFTLEDYDLGDRDHYWVLEQDGIETVQTIVCEIPADLERFERERDDMKFFAKAKSDIQYLLTQLEEAEKRERWIPSAYEIHNRFCGENGELCQACKIRSLSAPETEEQANG